MPKISDFSGKKVRAPKKPKKSKDGELVEKTSKLGKVHMAVFSPDSSQLVGFLVKRPDFAGVVARDDVFLAWDSFKVEEKYLLVTRPDDGLDDKARERLGIDWDRCVMWSGMDAQTVEGENLGYVSDAEFDLGTGNVLKYFVGDGGISRALVGSFEIAPSIIKGYSKGKMIVDTGGEKLELDGGFAATAGESYARAKAGAAEAGEKAGKAAGEAVDKGAYELGRMLGKAKRAIADATEDEEKPVEQAPAIEAADVHVSEPVQKLRASEDEREEAPEPKTYAPADDGNVVVRQETAGGDMPEAHAEKGTKDDAPSGSDASAAAPKAKTASAKTGAGATTTPSSKASSSTKKKSSATDGEKAARAVGKQIGRMGKMFSDFKDEYDKASK